MGHSEIIKKVILKDQVFKTVDFNRTKLVGIAYGIDGEFENFFKELLTTDDELEKLCEECVDLIIERYGKSAYPLQRFTYEDFEFVAEYMDFGDDVENSIFTIFWSLAEY